MERIFEYRMRPNRAQEAALFKMLAASRRLYNDALADAINILQARTGPSRKSQP